MIFQRFFILLWLLLFASGVAMAHEEDDADKTEAEQLAQAQAKALAQAQTEAAGAAVKQEGNSTTTTDTSKNNLRGDFTEVTTQTLEEQQQQHQELIKQETIRDEFAKREDDLILICLKSMYEADRDKDDALTLEEYRLFEKYYASQLNYPPKEMSGLFDKLVELGGTNPKRPNGINVLGCDPIIDRAIVGDERLEVLEQMCKILEGCLCCGVCFDGGEK